MSVSWYNPGEKDKLVYPGKAVIGNELKKFVSEVFGNIRKIST